MAHRKNEQLPFRNAKDYTYTTCMYICSELQTVFLYYIEMVTVDFISCIVYSNKIHTHFVTKLILKGSTRHLPLKSFMLGVKFISKIRTDIVQLEKITFQFGLELFLHGEELFSDKIKQFSLNLNIESGTNNDTF